MKSNIDQIIEKFKGVQSALESVDYSQALLAGVNAAKAKMQFRIFNRGMDSKGRTFGNYKGGRINFVSKKKLLKKFKTEETLKKITGKQHEFFEDEFSFTPYELKRLKKGRQVKYKDLEFKGDLRRGFKVVKVNDKKVVCAIPNEQLFKILGYQEEQLNTVISELSTEERQVLVNNTNAALKQLYDRIFNTSRPV